MTNYSESWDGRDYSKGGGGLGCIVYIVIFLIIIIYECSR